MSEGSHSIIQWVAKLALMFGKWLAHSPKLSHAQANICYEGKC